MKSIFLQASYYLIVFLLISFISLTKAYKYQYSDIKDEQVLDMEEKLIYDKSENLILTFAIFPRSNDDETYLITINKEKKIIGYMGTRNLTFEINNNYLTKITRFGEDYINDQEFNMLLNALNKIKYAEIERLYGFGGNDVILIYDNKIYETTILNDPIIKEIIKIIKDISPIDIVMPQYE